MSCAQGLLRATRRSRRKNCYASPWHFASRSNAQDAYLQHKVGLVDAMTLDNSMRVLKNVWLVQPVYRALWLDQAPSIAPEFAAVIDTTLWDVPLAKADDQVALFQANLAKVISTAEADPPI